MRSKTVIGVGLGLALSLAFGACGQSNDDDKLPFVDGDWGVARFQSRKSDCDRDVPTWTSSTSCELTLTQNGVRVSAVGTCGTEDVSWIGTVDERGLVRVSGESSLQQGDTCRLDVTRTFEVWAGAIPPTTGSTTTDAFVDSKFTPKGDCYLSPRCSGGANDGKACTTDANCPDQPFVDAVCACPGGATDCAFGTKVCVGGPNNTFGCADDEACPDQEQEDGFCDCQDPADGCRLDACSIVNGSTWTRR